MCATTVDSCHPLPPARQLGLAPGTAQSAPTPRAPFPLPAPPALPHLQDRQPQPVYRRRVGGGALQEAEIAPHHLLPAVPSDPLRGEWRAEAVMPVRWCGIVWCVL